MTSKKKIALLFGGRSAEHEVSLASASSIYKNLDRSKFDIVSIYINREGRWKQVQSPLVSREELDRGPAFSFLPWKELSASASVEADIYFPVLHGPFGEDGTIQGFFEMADVPYIGATVMASAAAMDKAVAKILFQAKNLPVPDHMVFKTPADEEDLEKILEEIDRKFHPPFFIKPANLGSSVGISKVKDRAQTRAAVELAFRFDRKILAEEGIMGTEIECSVLGNDHPRASLPGRLIPHREFYDYEDKYIEKKTAFEIPAALPQTVTEEIQHLAAEAFKAVECSGMARVDFFLQDKTQKTYVNEINTIPGFTEISMYPKLWEASGIPYPKLLEHLVELGLERHRQKTSLKNTFYS